MKKLFLMATMLLTLGFVNAQKIFSVSNQAFAGKNDGKWYFVDNQAFADKKIYFVDNQAFADLKIYFVDNQAFAGWKNSSKKSLMY
jgi:hypothetical protein